MQYVKVTNGMPEAYNRARLLADNPHISFPRSFSDALLEDYGVYRVTETQGLPGQIRDGFEQVDGVWQTKWRDKTAEEIASERARVRVTPYQLKMAIIDGGHLAAVRGVIQGLSGDQKEKLQLRLDHKPFIRADEGWVNQMLDAAGLSDPQKVALFEAAAAIDV